MSPGRTPSGPAGRSSHGYSTREPGPGSPVPSSVLERPGRPDPDPWSTPQVFPRYVAGTARSNAPEPYSAMPGADNGRTVTGRSPRSGGALAHRGTIGPGVAPHRDSDCNARATIRPRMGRDEVGLVSTRVGRSGARRLAALGTDLPRTWVDGTGGQLHRQRGGASAAEGDRRHEPPRDRRTEPPHAGRVSLSGRSPLASAGDVPFSRCRPARAVRGLDRRV